MPRSPRPETPQQYLKAYPHICSSIIAHSLGYATPSLAGLILKDAKEGKENWCEWIYSCYNRNPRKAVERAIKGRHHQHGYMAERKLAKALVDKVNQGASDHDWFASWF